MIQSLSSIAECSLDIRGQSLKPIVAIQVRLLLTRSILDPLSQLLNSLEVRRPTRFKETSHRVVEHNVETQDSTY